MQPARRWRPAEKKEEEEGEPDAAVAKEADGETLVLNLGVC